MLVHICMVINVCVWNKTSQVLKEPVHINVYIQLCLCKSLCNDNGKGGKITLKEEKKSDQAGQSGVHCVLKSVEKAENPVCSF